MVRQCEADRIRGECRWVFGDVADQAAVLGVCFSADGRINIRDDEEWYVVVDVGAERKIVEARLYVADAGCHDCCCDFVFDVM